MSKFELIVGLCSDTNVSSVVVATVSPSQVHFSHIFLVKLANEKLSVPVTCKIRVFEEIEKTICYAQMLEKAGCQVWLL